MSPWLALLGCVGRGTVPVPPPPVEVTSAPPAPSGRLEGDAFVDRSGLRLPVPAGWSSHVGLDTEALRWSTRSASGITLGAFRATDAPPSVQGCAWSFSDEGAYRWVKGRESLRVTTCAPEAADDPRALAWTFACGGTMWTLRLVAPPGGLAEGLDAAEALLRSVGCEQPAGAPVPSSGQGASTDVR